MFEHAPSTRSIFMIRGDDRVNFLQGILTNDILRLNDDKIQFAALLSPQGKILHDMFVVAWDNTILIDSAAEFSETLLKRLMMYKLRANIDIENVSQWFAVHYDSSGFADPRHPDLPRRLYTKSDAGPRPLAIHHSLALGIPELGRDFSPDSIVAMDAGYDLLNAISFSKGCYVGQEVIARMHYKQIARRGFYHLHNDTMPPRLALLKFEEVEAVNALVTVDNINYRAVLPAWMQPKLVQFKTTHEKQ